MKNKHGFVVYDNYAEYECETKINSLRNEIQQLNAQIQKMLNEEKENIPKKVVNQTFLTLIAEKTI